MKIQKQSLDQHQKETPSKDKKQHFVKRLQKIRRKKTQEASCDVISGGEIL
jgi:hypothetical protein